MSFEPLVVLVDLPEQTPNLRRALAQLGIVAQPVAPGELPALFASNPPQGIVTASESLGDVVVAIQGAGGDGDLPCFVLSRDETGTRRSRPPRKEVTAVVPWDIDPGVLCLRLKTALQRSRSAPRERQPTLVGFSSYPPAVQASNPQSASEQSTLPAARGAEHSSHPSESGAEQTSRSTLPPDYGAPGVVSSVPPAAPSTASAPTSPSQEESARVGDFSVPAQAPTPRDLEGHLPSPMETVSEQPVATSIHGSHSDLDAELAAFSRGSGKSNWFRYGAMAAGAAVAAGVVFSFMGPREEVSSVDPVAAAAPEQPTAATKEAESRTEPEAPPPAAPEAQEPAEVEPSDELSPLFKIENATEAKSCETLLGKTAEDFSDLPEWRSATAWKRARKSLMTGNQEAAQEAMCESAFINPSGPATSGLVKFYLGTRALEQAEKVASGDDSSRVVQELLGDVLSQKGEVARAKEIWLETMNLEGTDTARLRSVVKNYLHLGKKARRGGDDNLAERWLRRAATLQLDHPEVAEQLASVFAENGQPLLAERWAKRALSLNPDSALAQMVLDARN